MFQKNKSLIFLSSLFLMSACAKKSDIQEAQGDVQVQIGVQTSDSSYSLKTVQLKGIEKLNEVAGFYAQFFYSPGSSNDQLTGSSPHARFIKTKSFFVPSDLISMQMATIYYHLQNLADFDKKIGAGEVNNWPRSVGIETQVIDSASGNTRNNAFYNGQTDSMMFVPYTSKSLPIAMNAGIIAHEHFHSLFYKLVILPASNTKKLNGLKASVHSEDKSELPVLTQTDPTKQERALLFNETYLRGINEGLADFWGWVYTDDPEFMRWSLPQYQKERSLQLQNDQEGIYENEDRIFQKVDEVIQMTENPRGALINYAYQVGTPYARFLKSLTKDVSDTKKLSLIEAKKLVAQLMLNYIKDLSIQVKKLNEVENINPVGLFQYVAQAAEKNELIQLDMKSCEFLIKYLNLDETDTTKMVSCLQKNDLVIVVKP